MKKLCSILIAILFLSFFQSITYAVEKKATVTIILLDISGSMSSTNNNGNSRIVNAHNVISELLNNYNNYDWLGLRTIGAPPLITIEKLKNDSSLQFATTLGQLLKKTCENSELVVDINEGGASTIRGSLHSLEANGGSTPIEYTLRETIEKDFARFPSYMKKQIILITDGQEGCGGNPCEYIKKIRAERDDIIVDVISMLDEGENFSLYGCLSQATGGKVYSIDNKVIDIKPINPKVYPSNKTIRNKNLDVLYKHFLLEFN